MIDAPTAALNGSGIGIIGGGIFGYVNARVNHNLEMKKLASTQAFQRQQDEAARRLKDRSEKRAKLAGHYVEVLGVLYQILQVIRIDMVGPLSAAGESDEEHALRFFQAVDAFSPVIIALSHRYGLIKQVAH